MDDCCETYNCGDILRESNESSPRAAAHYDNEEFYPIEEEEDDEGREDLRHCVQGSQGDHEDEMEKRKHCGWVREGHGERYEGCGDDDPKVNSCGLEEQQRRLEKTVMHKAMIGIGPYLVEKAASVLTASRSYSGDLAHAKTKQNSVRQEDMTRKKSKISGRLKPAANHRNHRHPHEPFACNSRSQSLTKGFHKLRLNGHNTNALPRSRQLQSRGSSSQFRIQRGFAVRKVSNKSSSTSSVGRQKHHQPPIAPATKFPDGSVNQRLASAKRSMIKELKCRVTQLENQLKESQKENQILQRMQHRHEIALNKYEGAEAELPKMIRSHLAEVRTLQENLRKAHSLNRNTDDRMKARDTKIFRLEEENKALLALVKQNNLEERSKLSKQLEQARMDQTVAESRVADLQRHIEILEKNHRHQINVETKKLRNCNNKLFDAHQEIDKLYMALKEHERVITCMRMRQGQGQFPGLRMPSIQIFRDDASVRSSRTLPAKKSAKSRPSENNSFHQDQLRRQHSDTFDSSRRDPETHSGRSKHHLFYSSYDYSARGDKNVDEDNDGGASDTTKLINPRPHIPATKAIPVGRHTPLPLSPPSPGSSRQGNDFYQGNQTPRRDDVQHSSNMTTQRNRSISTSNELAGDGDDATQTEASEKSELGIEDEYYNFENVSVEEETSYRPQKTLFMDALDSSCNVSSMGQSPLNSMRSRGSNFRPASASPNCRIPPKINPKGGEKPNFQHPSRVLKSREQQLSSKGALTKEKVKAANLVTTAGPAIPEPAGPKALKRHADGEAVKHLSPAVGALTPGPPDSIMPSASAATEDGFISQRSASVDENLSGRQIHSIFTSSDSESEGNNSTRSDYSKSESGFSSKLTPKPGMTAIHVQNNREDDKNYSLIESVFNKWKQNKTNPFQSSAQHLSPKKDETTPRRREALLQKLKDMDCAGGNKKNENAAPLSNPAYFATDSQSQIPQSSGSPNPHEPSQVKSPQLNFKNNYQPFFNVNTNGNNQSEGLSPTHSPASVDVSPGCISKMKPPVLPWLTASQDGNKLKSKDVLQVSTPPRVDLPVESTAGSILINPKEKIGIKSQHSSILEPRHSLPTSVSAGISPSTEDVASPVPSEFSQHLTSPKKDAPRKKFTIGAISSLQANVQPSQIPSRIPKASVRPSKPPNWK